VGARKSGPIRPSIGDKNHARGKERKALITRK